MLWAKIFLRKLDFAKNRNLEKMTIFCAKNSFCSVLETFTFANACAIQTNLGTKVLLRKKLCWRIWGTGKTDQKMKKGYVAIKQRWVD